MHQRKGVSNVLVGTCSGIHIMRHQRGDHLVPYLSGLVKLTRSNRTLTGDTCTPCPDNFTRAAGWVLETNK